LDEVARHGGGMTKGWMSSSHLPLAMTNEVEGGWPRRFRVFRSFRGGFGERRGEN